ncbi:MAG: ISNCY family transposase [Sulfuritalea sp.]|nr:ISNCY family transposase [Sulfuritalea sp.]
MHIGEVDVSRIVLDAKSRDDIPQILRGLPHLYIDQNTRAKIFHLLETELAPEVSKLTGRPGMTLWSIFVCGVIRLDLSIDHDRLHELVNQHNAIRQRLGHGLFDPASYHFQTLKDNVSLFTPELLGKINQIVVDTGHDLVRKKVGEVLRGRCDSFVVETNVHYPTDISLLFDACRKVIELTARLSADQGSSDWRQHAYNVKQVKRHLRAAQSTKRRKGRNDAQQVFSVFQTHTEWISKGKAGVPVELGLRVCIMEDQHRFILHHQVMEKQTDDQVAVAMVKETKQRFADLESCSFDKGFHSPANQQELQAHLKLVALPRKGKLSQQAQAVQNAEDFIKARRQHSAVESAINALEVHGLDRCPDDGIRGFKRYVALAVVARNIHRIGAILREQENRRAKRKTRYADRDMPHKLAA